MFTGIIEELGKVESFARNASGARIVVAATIVNQGANEGDSIAVNGVCLTALGIKGGSFSADVSAETLKMSTLGSLAPGTPVNLERAVTPTTRLGGHIVQGHVDSRGRLVSALQNGEFWTVRVSFPREIGKYLIYKGSISVEGISLTIARLGDEWFEIAVIPKTWKMTNLSSLKAGDEVNLETDMIAKYVERILTHSTADKPSAVTMEKLGELGYLK